MLFQPPTSGSKVMYFVSSSCELHFITVSHMHRTRTTTDMFLMYYNYIWWYIIVVLTWLFHKETGSANLAVKVAANSSRDPHEGNWVYVQYPTRQFPQAQRVGAAWPMGPREWGPTVHDLHCARSWRVQSTTVRWCARTYHQHCSVTNLPCNYTHLVASKISPLDFQFLFRHNHFRYNRILQDHTYQIIQLNLKIMAYNTYYNEHFLIKITSIWRIAEGISRFRSTNFSNRFSTVLHVNIHILWWDKESKYNQDECTF